MSQVQAEGTPLPRRLPTELGFVQGLRIYIYRLTLVLCIVALNLTALFALAHVLRIWCVALAAAVLTVATTVVVKQMVYSILSRRDYAEPGPPLVVDGELKAYGHRDPLDGSTSANLGEASSVAGGKYSAISQLAGRSFRLPIIRVVGVGGAGGNSVNRMIEEGLQGVEFIAVSTDAQALVMLSQAPKCLLIGDGVPGLAAGDRDEVRKAAEESQDEIRELLQGSDLVVITAGMGGRTGTGTAPVIARIAKEEIKALTIAIVTLPFTFEGAKRSRAAMEGIEALKQVVDTLIVIPSDRLLAITEKRVSLSDAFRVADDVLSQGIQAITGLLIVPGLINLDFTDVQSIMVEGGAALLGVGHAAGENRAVEAVQQAISSRLLDITIDGARGILFNIMGGPNLTLFEVNEAASIIRETAHPDVNLIFGAVIDENMGDEVAITVIATGFSSEELRDAVRPADTRTQREEEPSSVGRASPDSVDTMIGEAPDLADRHSQRPRD